MCSNFNRGLDDEFIARLQSLASGPSWFRDVLNDPSLFLGVRDNKLQIYSNGQVLFTAWPSHDRLNVTTHEKFLLDPELRNQIAMNQDGEFRIEGVRDGGFIRKYVDKTTLGLLKKSADYYSDNERRGCHTIKTYMTAGRTKNSCILDCEISLEQNEHKVDLVSLAKDANQFYLKFWEAKLFTNRDLRAANGRLPRVLAQIERYRVAISANADQIRKSYIKIAKNFVCFKEDMHWSREISPLIYDLATNEPDFVIAPPWVGLLVFGFDQDQRVGEIWRRQRETLLKNQPTIISDLLARGKPNDIYL